MLNHIFSRVTLQLSTVLILLLNSHAHATIVQFQTVMGNFEVNLLDDEAPITVENFLNYVDEGAYSNSVFHRLEYNFVLQGGGWAINQGNDNSLLVDVPTDPPIANEAMYSNVRGTIAMAKRQDDPDSATSQWFINLTDNSANLDYQNEGFTVFGYVVSPGMEIVDSIAELNTVNFTQFPGMPLIDFTDEDAQNGPPEHENFVIVESVVVIDGAADTAADHTLSTIPPQPTSEPPAPSDSEGAGAINWWMLVLLSGCLLLRRRTLIA